MIQQKQDLIAAFDTMTDADRKMVVRLAIACAWQRPRPTGRVKLHLVPTAAQCANFARSGS